MHACASLIVTLLLSAAGQAGHPTQQVLQIHKDGNWTLTSQNSKPVWETSEYAYTVMVNHTEIREVTVDGVTKKQAVTVCKPETRTATRSICKFVTERQSRSIDPAAVRAFETDGRSVTPEAVVRRCSEPTLVVVSANSETIPAYYTEIFKPGTLILALLPQGSSAPPPQAGADASPELPTSLAPELVFFSRDGADKLKIRQYSEFTIDTFVSQVAADPQSASAPVPVSQVRRSSRTTSVGMNGLQFSTPIAAQLPLDKLKESLGAGEVTGLLARDGHAVNPFWLQNLRTGVLVARGILLEPEPQNSASTVHPRSVPTATPVPAAAPAPAVKPGS